MERRDFCHHRKNNLLAFILLLGRKKLLTRSRRTSISKWKKVAPWWKKLLWAWRLSPSSRRTFPKVPKIPIYLNYSSTKKIFKEKFAIGENLTRRYSNFLTM